jgi:hypothetical protein
MPDESKDPLANIQKHSYYLVIKNNRGESLKFDLNHADKLSEIEVQTIEESMEREFQEQTIDILYEPVTDSQAPQL